MSKPMCTWSAWDTACKGRAFGAWPVCRSHARVWSETNPLEASKFTTPVEVNLRMGVAFAEERGLGPGPWVQVWLKPTTSRFSIVLEPDAARVLADFYAEHGKDSAAMLIQRALGSGTFGRQLDLLAAVTS